MRVFNGTSRIARNALASVATRCLLSLMAAAFSPSSFAHPHTLEALLELPLERLMQLEITPVPPATSDYRVLTGVVDVTSAHLDSVALDHSAAMGRLVGPRRPFSLRNQAAVYRHTQVLGWLDRRRQDPVQGTMT